CLPPTEALTCFACFSRRSVWVYNPESPLAFAFAPIPSELLGNTEMSMIRRFLAVTLFTLAAVLSIIRMCCLLLFKNASRQFRKFPRRFFFEIGFQFGNCRRMIVEPKQYLRF